MQRNHLILIGVLVGSIGLAAGLSAIFGTEESGAAPDGIDTEPRSGAEPAATALQTQEGETPQELEIRRAEARQAQLDEEYPLHGLVTAAQLRVRAAADPESAIIGWLRLGGRVRVKRDPTTTARCATGFYELAPRGFVCAGQGVEVSEEEVEAAASENAANRDQTLPYRYLVAREAQVPEYHRLPSRDEQRAAQAHGRRYAELLNADQERRAERMRAGNVSGEPPSPAVVARYLQRGFYVASNAVEVRSRRRFVRTVRGTYVKEAQLIERTGSEFAGIELDEQHSLPIAWAVRTAHPLIRQVRGDGTLRFIDDPDLEAYERLSPVPWVGRARHGDQQYHELSGPGEESRYLRDWFVSVARLQAPPRGIGDDEPWVHVDLSEQTLVVYRGTTPLYTTLVSSGLEEHGTPTGEFTIRRKFVSDTMANLGPEAGDDAYRIEDVPFTQYFDGSIALHAAFWHRRFGLQRSHGCVNLAPQDARFIFEHTWPEIPEGWHGVSTERTGTERTGFEGSRVLVTE